MVAACAKWGHADEASDDLRCLAEETAGMDAALRHAARLAKYAGVDIGSTGKTMTRDWECHELNHNVDDPIG